MKNAAAIENYCGYFEKQIRQILSLPDPMYRKTLTVILLDTLARGRVPNATTNHSRFVEFVKTSCDWREATRVSLVQLAPALMADPKTSGGDLMREVEARLAKLEIGRVYRIDVDPDLSDLRKYVKAAAEEERLLKQHQHIELLYIYRNVLVHEFREPGYDRNNWRRSDAVLLQHGG